MSAFRLSETQKSLLLVTIRLFNINALKTAKAAATLYLLNSQFAINALVFMIRPQTVLVVQMDFSFKM
jgi:hypothetical protein